MSILTCVIYDQSQYDIRCDWGLEGMRHLAINSDVVIVVDVLSFTTSVEIAAARRAAVFPYRWKDASAYDFAEHHDAIVADAQNEFGYSLAPHTLTKIRTDTRIVLPSPNGSAICAAAGHKHVIAGCIRNAQEVAKHAMTIGRSIAVIPAGEKWKDGTMRPCVEDQVGAGAIISHLSGSLSPEASIAKAAFDACSSELPSIISGCISGREKIDRGEAADVEIASALNISNCVPILHDGAFQMLRTK